jgi:hypothetical protein
MGDSCPAPIISKNPKFIQNLFGFYRDKFVFLEMVGIKEAV